MNHLEIVIEDGIVEIYNQSDIDHLDNEVNKFLINQTENNIKFLKIHKCSQKVIYQTLKSVKGYHIETLKLVSFWFDEELTQILTQMSINEIDFEDFTMDTHNFQFLLKIKRGTFTFYKRNLSGLEQILDSIDLLENHRTLFEFNLGVNLNSYFETVAESTSNLLKIVDKLIKHRSQIRILDIDYETIPESVLESLVNFVKDNQTIRILNIPTLFSSHNLMIVLLAAISTASNLEMFLTNCVLFDQEILEAVAKIVECNQKIWHCIGDKDEWLSKFAQHKSNFEKFISDRLGENETHYYKCK